jgi:hypothetical protein
MAAYIRELTNHWKLWNEFDEWFIEKDTGIQLSNNLDDEWAHIWAGFRGIEDKPNAVWEEFLVDDASWTWTTEVGRGYVRLKGDAFFAPGNKIAVHIEYTLEDKDQLIEFKWKTTNNYKDFADVQQIVRNGRINVNGGNETPDGCWYRVYKKDDSIEDGPLPANITFNNITDSLENRYKLQGNSKDIDWRWNGSFDKNGVVTPSDVTIRIVDPATSSSSSESSSASSKSSSSSSKSESSSSSSSESSSSSSMSSVSSSESSSSK